MSRPPLAPRHTRKTEERADAALEQGICINYDSTPYTVRVGDVSPRLARELRRETGYSFNRLFELLEEDPDVDLIAAFIWLARRVAGEQVTLDEVEAAIGYQGVLAEGFDLSVAGAAEAGDDPEA